MAIEFEDGSTATHNMVGGSARPTRSIHILGTTGEIFGVFEDSSFVVRGIDPRPGHEYSEEVVDLNMTGDMHGAQGGHGGGDPLLQAQIFDPKIGVDPIGRDAGHFQGAASVLVGIAANSCFQTGNPVVINDICPQLGSSVHLSDLV